MARPAPTATDLEQIIDAAGTATSADDLLDTLLDQIAGFLGSDTAAILLLDPGGKVLVARAARGIEEEVRRGVQIPVGRGFAGRIAQERRPIAISDVDHAEILNPLLRNRGIKSLLGVPLVLDGRVLGVLHVGTLSPRDFSHADAELLTAAAGYAARAVDRAQAEEERLLLRAMHASVLPAELPVVPGVEVGGRYMPAATASSLGGDWYDVFTLADGRLGLVIGDVVGHGMAAATLMAQVRIAVRAYALEGHGPAAVAARVNELLLRTERGRTATAVFLAFDYENGEATAVSAGHLPPVIVREGSTELVPLGGAPPLGASRLSRYEERTFRLPEDSVVVLYTDGLVERRDEPIQAGLDRLLGAAATASRQPFELCDDLIDALVSRANHDDVAVVAVRMLPVPARFRVRLAADAEELAGLRRHLGRWLTARGADPDTAFDVTLACSEAAANALEHAYGPVSASFEVDGVEDGGELRVTVRDRGRWRPERASDRGRGLMLMRALVDRVDVEPAPGGGTQVILRKRLPEAAA